MIGVADLILHHFPVSPFSEKVRLILGFKGLAWKSVTVPMLMPKPDVVALTGGYRKTPFLQIGADVYCDTALIVEVLEGVKPTPSIFPGDNLGLAQVLAQWADNTLFWAAIRFNRGHKGAGKNIAGVQPELARALFADRTAMGFDMDWVSPADASTPFQTYRQRVLEILADKPYLMGTSPCIADFAAVHSFWYLYARPSAAMGMAHLDTKLQQWMKRMMDFGHGQREDIDAAQSIDIAARSQPLPVGQGFLRLDNFVDDHGIALGSRVSIAAESFGTELTHGELIAATSQHYSLRRTDPRAGTVHVHFPRIGYVLKT
jgi:glutathione S-transferase